MPHRKVPAVISLQKVNVGNVHKSDNVRAKTTGHVTGEMRAEFVSQVKELGSQSSSLSELFKT